MERSENKIREYTRRIMTSRMRLLCDNGFYGLLLMHQKMHLSNEHDTVWADGQSGICFNPAFLEKISDRELDYVLMHVLLHLALDHTERSGNYEKEYYDQAADIVVNSNILRSVGGEEAFISLREFGGVQPHLAPNGEEGALYSVEELYAILYAYAGGKGAEGSGDPAENGSGKDAKGSGDPAEKGSGKDAKGSGDPAENGSGKGAEGAGGKGNGKSGRAKQGFDDHSWIWERGSQSTGSSRQEGHRTLQRQEWQGWILQSAEAVSKRETKGRGILPAFVERYLEELKKPQTDWRTVLEEFIQEEINDYSFCPPDRRFEDSPFFLPDFNEKEYRIEKILFMIDASGSMSDPEVTQCYSEVKGAIDQFNGKLEGWLGFFDAAVTEPKPFVDEEEFRMIRPKGGGGTSFDVIFSYVRDKMADQLPVSIVILTDGEAPFPNIRKTMNIPVLWVINNETVTPPWGKIARISV